MSSADSERKSSAGVCRGEDDYNVTRRTLVSMRTPAMRKLAFQALRLTLLPFVLREVCQRKKVTILVYHAPSAEVLDTHLGLLKRMYNIISLSVYIEARLKGDYSK